MARSRASGAGGAGPRSRKDPVDLEALRTRSGTLTAVERQQAARRRYSLFVDGEFAVGIAADVLAPACLKVGAQVTGATLVELAIQDEGLRAWDAALLYLSGTGRTRREVERRLSRSYAPESVERVLARLSAGGWVDDLRYAAHFVAARPDLGQHRLLADLLRRGVAREVAMAAVRAGFGPEAALAGAREAAAARLSRMGAVDRATAQRRLGSYLSRRGHDFETIAAVLAPLLSRLPAAASAGPGRRRQQRRQPEGDE